MLDLMNNARLGVAAQGIGIAEAAYRQARAYAAARVQFGAPIEQQPLVKSMLARDGDPHRRRRAPCSIALARSSIRPRRCGAISQSRPE